MQYERRLFYIGIFLELDSIAKKEEEDLKQKTKNKNRWRR